MNFIGLLPDDLLNELIHYLKGRDILIFLSINNQIAKKYTSRKFWKDKSEKDYPHLCKYILAKIPKQFYIRASYLDIFIFGSFILSGAFTIKCVVSLKFYRIVINVKRTTFKRVFQHGSSTMVINVFAKIEKRTANIYSPNGRFVGTLLTKYSGLEYVNKKGLLSDRNCSRLSEIQLIELIDQINKQPAI